MNSDLLKRLVRINLLYANPQTTARSRERGKTGGKMTWALVQQYVLSGFFLTLMYGLLLVAIDLNHAAGTFDAFVGVFAILAVSQSISTINNVFFESRDQTAYLPLPIPSRLVFLAKMVVVFIAVLPMVLPLVYIFIITGFQAGINPVIAVVWSIVLFILLAGLLMLFCTYIVFGLARTKLFQRHQKLVTFAMLAVSFLAMMAGIVMLNLSTAGSGNQAGIPVLDWFHQAVTTPFAGQTLVGMVVLLVLVIGLAWGVDRFLLNQLMVQPSNTSVKRKRQGPEKNRSFRQRLVRYNLGLLQNPTLLLQALSMMLLPYVMAAAGFLTGSDSTTAMAGLAPKYWGLFLFAGFLGGAMTNSGVSLIGVSISLDLSNLSYVMAMPISLERYLRLKFWTICGLQSLVVSLLGVAAAIYLNFGWLHGTVLVIGLFLGVVATSRLFFARDWRLLDLDWSNITTLFNRGGGNVLTFGIVFGGFIVGAILIFLDLMMMDAGYGLLVNIVALLLVLGTAGASEWWFGQRYWRVHLPENARD